MNVGRFASWFSERGYPVRLACVDGSPLSEFAKEKGLETIAIAHHRKYFDLKNASRLAKIWNEVKPDVVWIRDTRDMGIVAWTKHIAKVKPKVVYQQAMQLGVKKKDLAHTLRFKAIDVWISPLYFLAEQVKTMTRFPSERIEVIPLALDTKRFSNLPSREKALGLLELPIKPVYLGNVGRIDPLKGQAFLIDVLNSMKDEYPNLHLLLVGDPTKNEGDNYLKSLQAKAEDFGIADRVHLRPHRPDVETAYAAIDIFAMSSVGETFGMVTIEAMCSGKPIIGTNTSGTPELLEYGEVGALYTPDDLTTFCDQLNPLLSDESSRAALGRKAKASAIDRFDVNSVMKRLSDLDVFS